MSAQLSSLGVLLADGRLPTGGHAHSNGLEAGVRIGELRDVAGITRFVTAKLRTQGVLDATFAAAAAQAAETNDPASLGHVLVPLVAEFDARTPSTHLRAESRTLGRHLRRVAARLVEGAADPERAVRAIAAAADAPRPIVAGVVTVALGHTSADAATIECHHLVSSLGAAAVKLLGLDPLAIVEIQASLTPELDALVADVVAAVECHPGDVAAASVELPAASALRSDVLAEWHAADRDRLFAT